MVRLPQQLGPPIPALPNYLNGRVPISVETVLRPNIALSLQQATQEAGINPNVSAQWCRYTPTDNTGLTPSLSCLLDGVCMLWHLELKNNAAGVRDPPPSMLLSQMTCFSG